MSDNDKRVHVFYVLDDGETYTGTVPVAVAITDDEFERIVGGEKVYNVVPDWETRGGEVSDAL